MLRGPLQEGEGEKGIQVCSATFSDGYQLQEIPYLPLWTSWCYSWNRAQAFDMDYCSEPVWHCQSASEEGQGRNSPPPANSFFCADPDLSNQRTSEADEETQETKQENQNGKRVAQNIHSPPIRGACVELLVSSLLTGGGRECFFSAVMDESIYTFGAARLFHSHTNQHLKLLSKYILFWTFVSFIWQKKNRWWWWICKQTGEMVGGVHLPTTVLCDVTSSQANNTSRSLPPTQEIINLSGMFWTHCRLNFTFDKWATFHLVCWATAWRVLDHQWNEQKQGSNSWILLLFFGRNQTNKKQTCPPDDIKLSLWCRW